MNSDEILMQSCLSLAIKGIGDVAPNPMVGCVIVADGKIIGEGYHQQYGSAHAEVNAVNAVPEELKNKLSEATLFVNLEPCSHYGKTPPCADMIIRHKIPRVVIGSNDPNPQVGGKGIQKLRDAGVEVIVGRLKKECDFLNRRFLTYWQKQRPYIILKWAQSSDGFMAPDKPGQLWLTNDASKKLVHQWRSEEAAILVGKNTIEIDNPELTVRLVEGKNPVRITFDRNLNLKDTYKFFNPGALVIVFNADKDWVSGQCRFVKIDFNANVLQQAMNHLFAQQIQSIIVEGGPFTLEQFIAANLWDEARVFTTSRSIGKGKRAPELNRNLCAQANIENDTLRSYER